MTFRISLYKFRSARKKLKTISEHIILENEKTRLIFRNLLILTVLVKFCRLDSLTIFQKKYWLRHLRKNILQSLQHYFSMRRLKRKNFPKRHLSHSFERSDASPRDAGNGTEKRRNLYKDQKCKKKKKEKRYPQGNVSAKVFPESSGPVLFFFVFEVFLFSSSFFLVYYCCCCCYSQCRH